jgi:formylglycine-generating enzyme required for sulfatase activity
MSIVGKRAETSETRHSFSAATFRKVLKGFEIGGLPYAEVQFQLKRLLATGASPGELREVLRRSELIEPLPEYAHREVQGLLDEAIEQNAALQSDANIIDQEQPLDPLALSAELADTRSALESEQARAREAEEALSERIASEEAARTRLDNTLRESERYQAELRTARNSMESRDKVIAQMRQALDERDAELAAAHAELDDECRKSEEFERSLTDSNSLTGAARESLASQAKMIGELRQTLAARDTQLAALQREHAETQAALTREHTEALASLTREHAETLASLESSGKSGAQLQSELKAARAQAASLGSELTAARATLNSERASARTALDSERATGRTALDSVRSQHHKALKDAEDRARGAEEKSHNLQKRLDAAKADLDALRAQAANLQAKLRDDDSLIEKLNAHVKSEAKRAKQWQATAQQLESAAESAATPMVAHAPVEVDPPGAALPQVEVYPRLQAAPAATISAELPRSAANGRGRRSSFRLPPVLWIGAAIILLATAAIWLTGHRPAPAPSKPAAAVKATAVQPGKPGTTLRDCPTCPELTVLPAGRFEQGSAASENNSAFEKPLHWVMIARPIALSTNPVTVDEFRAFATATGRDMQGCDTYDGAWRRRPENNWENPGFAQTGSHPVTCASWNDAKAYAAWLSAKTGQHYRLPSASEWEYAARAGGAAAQPWNAEGSDACASANVADESAGHRFPGWTVFACNDGFVQTSPVGSFKANSFGLNDMLGNVFQWTEDCWNADYKGAPIDGTARADGDCTERELRGGSWFSTPSYVRANYRNHFGVDYRGSSVGIRLARDIKS